jgi:hypothetical protein
MVLVFDRLIPPDREPAFLRGSQLRPILSKAGQMGLKSLPPETTAFIDQLKKGTVPWQVPWRSVQNIVSRKPYRVINSLLLGSTEFQSPFWLTFKQTLDLGGHVKKGAKSTPVIYYKFLEKTDPTSGEWQCDSTGTDGEFQRQALTGQLCQEPDRLLLVAALLLVVVALGHVLTEAHRRRIVPHDTRCEPSRRCRRNRVSRDAELSLHASAILRP